MRVMYAAHILQEIYSNEKCLTTPYNIIYKTIAWLNHLFNENYNLPMREDFFHIYKILKNMDEDIQPQDIGMVLKYMPRTSSFLNDSFYKLTEDFSQNMNFDEIFDLLEKIKNDSFTLQSFIRCTKSDLRFITRYSKLFNHHSPIEQIKRICHLCNKKHIAIKELKQMNKQNDSKLLPLRTFYLLPLFLFGLIANKVYNISKEDAINCVKNELMPDILYTFSFNADIVKERVSQYGQVTTEDFLSVSPDDRLYWWNETFILSDECKQWFVALKQKYNQAILEEEQNSSLTNLDFLKYFLSILTEHKTLFPTVIMFKNVFYDILNHSEDAHYRAMVRLISQFESTIDPKLSGEEIKKEHDIIKKYFALLANPQLRLKVLGI